MNQVRCNKIYHRFDPKAPTHKYPVLEGYVNVNVCSNGSQWSRNLSPMLLGPLIIEEPAHPDITGLSDDRLAELGIQSKPNMVYNIAQNVENAWQASKICQDELDAEGAPVREFFVKRKRFWDDPKAHRHAKGKNTVAVYVGGRVLPYGEARKELYCRAYELLVQQSPAFARLKEMVQQGQRIQILGYDGYDFDSEGKSLDDCMADTTRPFGHELILVALLRGERPWSYY